MSNIFDVAFNSKKAHIGSDYAMLHDGLEGDVKLQHARLSCKHQHDATHEALKALCSRVK